MGRQALVPALRIAEPAAQGERATGPGEYVRRQARINGMESFWATMKRAYYGVYHKWNPKHLRRYVGEFAGRHNFRCEDTIAQMATSPPKRRKQCRSTILRNGTLDTLRRLVTWIGDAMRTRDDVTKWLVREFSFAPATAEADIGNLVRAGS